MSSSGTRVIAAVGGLVLSVGVLAGCSKTISGTPQADPVQVAEGSAPSGLDTTCEEYGGLTDDQKRDVIAAIGEQNQLVERSPELWVTLAGALCTFSDPDATVKDVLNGQGVR
jgi:hypothetical protein